MKREHTFDLVGLRQSAKTFIQQLGDRSVVAFYGKMGAGKTTFIKAICQELGVDDTINSPTFSLINEYLIAETGEHVYHFDFYRIDKLAEAQDIGAEEYFESGALCLIEWPEMIEELLPDDVVRVAITERGDEERTITFLADDNGWVRGE